MDDERPLVLILLNAVQTAFCVLSSIISLPFHLCVAACQPVILHENFSKDREDVSRLLYCAMFIPRWIFVTLLIPGVFLGYTAGVGYASNKFGGIGAAVGLALVMLLMIVVGVWYTSKKCGDRGTFLRLNFGSIMSTFFSAQLDIIALCGLIAGMLTIIRLPHYHLYFRQRLKENMPYRAQMIIEPLYGLFDLLVLPVVIVVMISHRMFEADPRVHRHLTLDAEALAWSGELRCHFVGQFARLVVDIIFLGLCAILLLMPWRFVYFLPQAMWKARQEHRERPTEWINEFPGIVVTQIGEVIVDITTTVSLLIVTCSLYRIWFAARDVKNGVAFRTAIMSHAALVFADIPFFIMGLVAFVSFTRTIWVVHDVWKATDASERRKAAGMNFLAIFRDIFELPFIALGIIVTASVWRGVTYIKDLRRIDWANDSDRRCKGRTITLAHFARLLIDIPCLACFVFVIATLFRSKNLCLRLKAAHAKHIDIDGEYEVELYQRQENPADNPAAELEAQKRLLPIGTAQIIVFQEFFFTIIDIPFVILYILTCLTLFRGVLLFRLLRETKDDWERRLLVLSQFGQFLLDFPALLSLILLTFTWRSVTVWRALLQSRLSTNKHAIIFYQLFQLVWDLPFLALAVLCLWRIPMLAYHLLRLGCRRKPRRKVGHSESSFFLEAEELENSDVMPANADTRRAIVVSTFTCTLKDIPCIFMSIFMTIFVWRLFFLIPRLFRRRQLRKRRQERRRTGENAPQGENADPASGNSDAEFTVWWIILEEFAAMIIDLPALFFGLLLIPLFWRGVFTIVQLYRSPARLAQHKGRSELFEWYSAIRERVVFEALLGIVDILAGVCVLPIVISWRSPTLLANLKWTDTPPPQTCRTAGSPTCINWTSEAVYRAVFLTLVLLAGDIFAVFLLLWILVTVFSVPMTLYLLAYVWRNWKSEPGPFEQPLLSNIQDSHENDSLIQYLTRPREQQRWGTWLAVSLGFWPPPDLAQNIFRLSVVRFRDWENISCDHPDLGYLVHKHPRSLTMFWHVIHIMAWRGLTHDLINFVLVPIKVLGFMVAVVGLFMCELCTLFASSWHPTPQRWSEVENAVSGTNFFSLLGVLLTSQVILLPVWLAMQFGLFGFPIGLSLLVQWGVGADHFTVSTGVIVAQVLWSVLVMPRAWYRLWTLVHEEEIAGAYWHPILAVVWLIFSVIIVKTWRFYRKIFVLQVKYCYRRRRDCCYLGEWLVAILYLIWALWPLAVAFGASRPHIPQPYVYIPLAVVCLALLVRGKGLLQESWVSSELPPAQVTLTSILVEFPGYGLRLRLRGTKPENLHFDVATMDFYPEEFWEGLGSLVKWPVRQAINVFRAASFPYPIQHLLNPAHFPRGATEISTVIDIETSGEGVSAKLPKARIQKRLRGLIEKTNDQAFKLVVFYSNPLGERGVLLVVNATPSAVLRAAEEGLDLVTGLPPVNIQPPFSPSAPALSPYGNAPGPQGDEPPSLSPTAFVPTSSVSSHSAADAPPPYSRASTK